MSRKARLHWLGAICLLALAYVPPAHSTRIYRCVVDGLVTYADRDCGDRSTPVAIHIARAGIVFAGAHAGATGPVMVGMSPQEVHDLMGRPSAMGVRLEGTTLAEDWTYRDREGSLRVVFRHGEVSQVTMH